MIFSQETFNLENLSGQKIYKNYEKQKKYLIKCIKSKSFGFIDDLYKKDYSEIIKLASGLKGFDNILFLGTGGSSLGGKTLVSVINNCFYNKTRPNIYFIENVDSSSIFGLLKNINLNSTACVVTSKSGETIETISQFFYVSNIFKKKKNILKKEIFYYNRRQTKFT